MGHKNACITLDAANANMLMLLHDAKARLQFILDELQFFIVTS